MWLWACSATQPAQAHHNEFHSHRTSCHSLSQCWDTHLPRQTNLTQPWRTAPASPFWCQIEKFCNEKPLIHQSNKPHKLLGKKKSPNSSSKKNLSYFSCEQKVSVVQFAGPKLGQVKSSQQFLHFHTKIIPEGEYLMHTVKCLIFIRRFWNLAATVCYEMTLNSTKENHLRALKEHLALPWEGPLKWKSTAWRLIKWPLN